jgi:hypothetical protein
MRLLVPFLGCFACAFACSTPPGSPASGSTEDDVRPAAEALVRGFETVEIGIVVDRSAATSFTVVAPKNARYLNCGLFSSDPRFDEQRIQGCPRSLVRSRTFRVSESSGSTQDRTFTLSPSDLNSVSAYQDPNCPSLCGLASTNCATLVKLSFGCWAVGDDRPLAATALIELDSSDLQETQLPLSSCLDENLKPESDGRTCRVPGRCDGLSCVAIAEQLDASVAMPDVPDGGEISSRGAFEAFVACRLQSDAGAGARCVSSSLGSCQRGSCRPLRSEDTNDRLPLFVPSCEPHGTDLLNCTTPPYGKYGSCFGNVCRSRCTVDEDCRVPDGLLQSGPELACHHFARRDGATCERTGSSPQSEANPGLCLEASAGGMTCL